MEKQQTNNNNNPSKDVDVEQPVVAEQPDSPSVVQNEQQDLICDFSSMFKKKGNFTKKVPKNKATQNRTPNWLLQIPAKLELTAEDLRKKSVLDNRKWMCVAKCAQPSQKIIAAVCTCVNFLTSQIGIGKDKFLSVNKFVEFTNLQLTGQINQYDRFQMVKRIIQAYNKVVEHKLSAQVCMKFSNPQKLQQSTIDQKDRFLYGIEGNKQAYIYLAYGDIFCPIGFDRTPLQQLQAYQKIENIQPQNQQLWIISSTLGRNQPSFCIKRWTDIQKDLETVWPNYLDIKEAKQGVRVRPDATEQNKDEDRGTSNCIIKISFK